MKKDFTEYLGFDDEPEKKKVGRPKLADDKTKKKSLIIASVSFCAVIILLIFGYGTLFGFKNFRILGSVAENRTGETILIDEIKPLINNITIKVGTVRKVYLTVLPAKATNKNITYESSDTSVAVVDGEGKVSGISEGNAIITARTIDGSNKKTSFNVKVIKDASGKCDFSSLSKSNEKINYSIKCENADIKEVQYQVGNAKYEKLNSNKNYGTVNFSKDQLKNKITFKVVYYPNNSKISKYSEKTINPNTVTTKEIKGACALTLDDVKSNSIKYDVTCENADVIKIAYKIGNGSYVGIETSNLADTIIFEESEVTRIIYFNVEYKVKGSNSAKTITKSSVIASTSKGE